MSHISKIARQGECVALLQFADDQLFLNDSLNFFLQVLQSLIDKFEHEASQEFNCNKSQLVFSVNTPPTQLMREFRHSLDFPKAVTSMDYLGTIMGFRECNHRRAWSVVLKYIHDHVAPMGLLISLAGIKVLLQQRVAQSQTIGFLIVSSLSRFNPKCKKPIPCSYGMGPNSIKDHTTPSSGLLLQYP